MAMTVPINEQNGLHELKEYIFRVFLETLYGMMESGQVSGLDKTKIKVNFLEGTEAVLFLSCVMRLKSCVVDHTCFYLCRVCRGDFAVPHPLQFHHLRSRGLPDPGHPGRGGPKHSENQGGRHSREAPLRDPSQTLPLLDRRAHPEEVSVQQTSDGQKPANYHQVETIRVRHGRASCRFHR